MTSLPAVVYIDVGKMPWTQYKFNFRLISENLLCVNMYLSISLGSMTRIDK